jgi:hypothetical protein
MSSENEKGLIACIGILFGIILIPLLAIYHGWILTILWGWFVVPTFHLPELSIAVAIGLSLIVGMFKSYSVGDNKNLTTEDKLVGAVVTLVGPLLTLLFGYIVHLFM